MDQERSFRMFPATMQPSSDTPTPTHDILPTPAPPEPHRFSCTLPAVSPQILTPPMPLASSEIRLLDSSQNIAQHVQLTDENRPSRVVTLQYSYNVLTPSTSRDEAPGGDPNHIIGYQKAPLLQKRHRQQQKSESKAAKAPIDIRDKVNEDKRARERVERSCTIECRGSTNPFSYPKARS